MSEESHSNGRQPKADDVQPVYRIRRDQAISTLALPIVITLIGLILTFGRYIYTDRDARIDKVRQEFRAADKDVESRCIREIERLEARQNEEHKRLERWIITIQEK